MAKVYPDNTSSGKVDHEVGQVTVTDPQYVLTHTQTGIRLCEV